MVDAAEGVDDRRVDLKVREAVRVTQTVIDDRGDQAALGRAAGLLLDHGGDRDQLIDRELMRGNVIVIEIHIAVFLREVFVEQVELTARLVGELAVKVGQQLVQHALGIVVLIEIIGIREQEALERILLPLRNMLQEPIVEACLRRALLQRLGRADVALFHQLKDLAAGIALRDRHADSRAVRAVGHHALDERVIVIVVAQLIGARLDLAAGLGELAVKLEEPRILDEALVVELLRDLVYGGVFGDRDRMRIVRAAEGHHVLRAFPCAVAKADCDQADDHDVKNDLHEQRHHAVHAAALRLFGRGSVTVVVVFIVIRIVIFFVIILRLWGLLLRRSLLLRPILAVIGEAVAEIGRERIVRSARIVPTVGRDGRLRRVLRGRVAARGGKKLVDRRLVVAEAVCRIKVLICHNFLLQRATMPAATCCAAASPRSASTSFRPKAIDAPAA